MPHNSGKEAGALQTNWVAIPDLPRLAVSLDEIAQLCGWRLRSGSVPEVCTVENYNRQAPNLLRLRSVGALEHTNASDYEFLNRWPLAGADLTSARAATELAWANLESAGTDAEWWAWVRMVLMTTSGLTLGATVRTIYERGTARVPGLTLWTIEFDPRLLQRFTLNRVLFAARYTPGLLATPPDEFGGLQAGRGQMPGTILGLGALLEPALLATAPYVAGVMAPRPDGAILFLYPEPVLSVPAAAANLLEIYRPRAIGSIRTPGARDAFRSSGNASPFIAWWVRRTDRLVSELTDPARFRDSAGNHDPGAQTATWMSVERLFASVEAILSHDSDDFVRLRLYFDTIDLIAGLRLATHTQLKDPAWLTSQLGRLEQALGPRIGPTAMPRCRVGLDALDRMAGGFFGPLRSGDVLSLPSSRGPGTELVPTTRAVSEYLGVIRDTVHSYVGFPSRPRDAALVAAHDGLVPAEVADLSWLYLIRLLIDGLSPRES